MKTIETLKNKITENRYKFIVALLAAGYERRAIIDDIDNDSELLRLAIEIYNDNWEAFNVEAFESLFA